MNSRVRTPATTRDIGFGDAPGYTESESSMGQVPVGIYIAHVAWGGGRWARGGCSSSKSQKQTAHAEMPAQESAGYGGQNLAAASIAG